MIALAAAATAAQLAIGLDDRVGAPLPQDLAFTDSSGARVTLGQYLAPHRPLVLVLGYARCRMLCNVVLRGVADAIRTAPAVAGKDYLPVVVSLDPRESVPEAAHRQATLLELAHLTAPAAWPYLVGDAAPLAAALGFHYAYDPHTEQYAHPAVVFVIAPDGRVAAQLRGVVYPELADAVARATRGELAHPDANDVLRCFHFDPALRRYEGRLQLFFRAGAAGVLAALVVGAGLAIRALTRRGRR
jgi:protein SCO1